MPLPLAGLLAIQGGMQLGNSLLNNWMQGNDMQQQQNFNQQQSADQRIWNFNMAQIENQWARENWNMQNQYNTPQMQMARFKAAGLNPHLIYGQGNPGNAQSIQTPDVKPYTKAEASNHIRGMKVFGDIFQAKNIQAQTDNLKANTELAQQNALLTAQKTATEAITGKRSELDYGIAQALKETQIEAAKANLERTQQDINKGNLDIQFAEKTLSPRVRMIYQELNNAAKDGKLKDMDAQLKKWEIELNKSNLTKSDNVILRLIKGLIDSPFGGIFNPKY